MKNIVLITSAFMLLAHTAMAQTVEHNWNDFHDRSHTTMSRAIPLPYVRESDVIWESIIWQIGRAHV